MSHKNYLIFRSDRQLFAIDSKHIKEATLHNEFSPLPFAKKHVLGMCNLRGDIYPVLNPWHEVNRSEEGSRQILVEVDKTSFLLYVSEILDSHSLPKEEIEQWQQNNDNSIYGGRFKNKYGLVEIVLPNKLLKHLE